MAKLKIFENNDPNGPPGRDGYISVTREILKPDNFTEFVEADPGERADLLNQYALHSSSLYVQHEVKSSGASVSSEQIDRTNCKVMVEFDVRKFRRRSKHTISFPDAMPGNVDYLQPYVDAIVALNAANPANARRFLFGIMLLTRCR